MALVRDFCTQPQRLARLGSTVYLFIPVYNVDGCLNRNTSSRVNQVGPESFGFRGNGRNLDLNRDFVKCDSLSAQAFKQAERMLGPTFDVAVRRSPDIIRAAGLHLQAGHEQAPRRVAEHVEIRDVHHQRAQQRTAV